MIALSVVHPVPSAPARRRPGAPRTLGYARIASPATLREVDPGSLLPGGRPGRLLHGDRLWTPLMAGGSPVRTEDLAAWLSLADTSSRIADDLRDAFRRTPVIAAWTDPPTLGMTRAPRASRGMAEAPPPREEDASRARSVLADWIAENLLACRGVVNRRMVHLWRLDPEGRPSVRRDKGHDLRPYGSPAVRGSLVRGLAEAWHPGSSFPEDALAEAEGSVESRHEGDDDLVRLACALPDLAGDIGLEGEAARRLSARARDARLGWLLPGEPGVLLDLARAALATSDGPAAEALLRPLVAFSIPRMVPRGEAVHDDEADLTDLAP